MPVTFAKGNFNIKKVLKNTWSQDGGLLFEVTLSNEKEILEPASARIDLKLQLEQWMTIYQRKGK